jgi:hypothetical protein
LRVLSFLNIEIEEEKSLLNNLKLRIINICNLYSKKGPVYYYNMASMFSVLEDYEECKKYYYLCFYYDNGKEITNWNCEQMLDLYRNGKKDRNLFNVSHFDWFTIQFYEEGIQDIQLIEEEYENYQSDKSPEDIEDEKMSRINNECIHEINTKINSYLHKDEDDFEDEWYEGRYQYTNKDEESPFFWNFEYLKKYIIG